LPAVSFLGGFQTPAGPNKTCAHPAGRHLKPITKNKTCAHPAGRHLKPITKADF